MRRQVLLISPLLPFVVVDITSKINLLSSECACANVDLCVYSTRSVTFFLSRRVAEQHWSCSPICRRVHVGSLNSLSIKMTFWSNQSRACSTLVTLGIWTGSIFCVPVLSMGRGGNRGSAPSMAGDFVWDFFPTIRKMYGKDLFAPPPSQGLTVHTKRMSVLLRPHCFDAVCRPKSTARVWARIKQAKKVAMQNV